MNNKQTNEWTNRQKTTIKTNYINSHPSKLVELPVIFPFYGCYSKLCKQHTHTHPFNGLFFQDYPGKPVPEGKTNLDFTEARDTEWQWHQLGHMQVCNSLQTDNHASTPPLIFLQAGCPSCHPTNSVKALKAISYVSKRTLNKLPRLVLWVINITTLSSFHCWRAMRRRTSACSRVMPWTVQRYWRRASQPRTQRWMHCSLSFVRTSENWCRPIRPRAHD